MFSVYSGALRLVLLTTQCVTMAHSLMSNLILDAWDWCTEMTQRDGMGREKGGGFRMGNTCIPVADSC